MPRRRIPPDEPRILAASRDQGEALRIAAWLGGMGVAACVVYHAQLRRWEVLVAHVAMKLARRLYADACACYDDAGAPLPGREAAAWD
jgi:hypothetical protein